MAHSSATVLSARLAAAQASAERLTGLWTAAERGKAVLLRGAGEREAQAAAYTVERLQAQVRGARGEEGRCVW
jgi:50S ribosomal subunit-associated GTPase HflX